MKIKLHFNCFFAFYAIFFFSFCFISCDKEFEDEINNSTQTDIKDNPGKDKAEFHNGHECIDLGLPSGVKWATMNIGAKTPTDYGYYIAWGETAPYPIDNYDYSERNNKYYTKGNVPVVTKYTTKDRLFKLENNDDPAFINWGDKWRTPTFDDIVELLSNTNVYFENIDGVNVCLFKSKKNSKSIIIPCGGYRSYKKLYFENEQLVIPSCELNYKYTIESFYRDESYIAVMRHNQDEIGTGCAKRYSGLTFRPVYGDVSSAPIDETCPRCDGSGICQSCYGTGKCISCNGNYKKGNDINGYPIVCSYCTGGRCPGCDGNKRCNLCKGTGKH